MAVNCDWEIWVPNVPDTLRELCLAICVRVPGPLYTHSVSRRHSHDFDSYHSSDLLFDLRPNVSLPREVCESLLRVRRQQPLPLDDTFLAIFRDPLSTPLQKIDLRGACISDSSLNWLMRHCPTELDLSPSSDCPTFLTSHSLEYINRDGSNLLKLFLGEARSLFDNINRIIHENYDMEEVMRPMEFENILKCPELRAFSLHYMLESEFATQDILFHILKKLTLLQFLDLTGCEIDISSLFTNIFALSCSHNFVSLSVLILHNVPLVQQLRTFDVISRLENLSVLDLSQDKSPPIMHPDPVRDMFFLLENLKYLKSLDVSGTNLGDFLKKSPLKSKKANDAESTDCRILNDRQWQFLGLLSCANDVCNIKDLPAKEITGHANEDQVILSVRRYVDRPELLFRSLNNLYNIFRYEVCNKPYQALVAILDAMKNHISNKNIQISGSATLFYLVKGEEKSLLSIKMQQRVITVILDAMWNHMEEPTMLRNGCLTLCHFKIPQSILFAYKRVVKTLLEIIQRPDQEEFVQRVTIYILNSLACQVDEPEKKLVGDLGAIQIMISLINYQLEENICNEITEMAWSTMWNVTDETAINCERFIKEDGIQIFLSCLKKFPEKPELLRNMMGLMGNVAEVQELRKELMDCNLIKVFTNLLSSDSDGIEVSYNACGVLAHLVTESPSSWFISEPSRAHVLTSMERAINGWNLKTERNINYRSFQPILRLVNSYGAPQAQHWAVWALCNLTKMYRGKYCSLVMNENGLNQLTELVQDTRPYPEIKRLATQVIRRCQQYNKEAEDIETDED